MIQDQPIAVQVAFPYLYNNRPRRVRLSTYHHPMVMYIKMEDPDLPAFYYDPLIHPIAFYKNEATSVETLADEEEEDFELPEGVHSYRHDRLSLFFAFIYVWVVPPV